MGKGTKILALAGIATGVFLAVDRVQNGNWIWERTTAKLRLQQAQIQQQVQLQVQQQLQARERARLQKEKTEVMRGKYAQAGWTTPTTNYGLSRY